MDFSRSSRMGWRVARSALRSRREADQDRRRWVIAASVEFWTTAIDRNPELRSSPLDKNSTSLHQSSMLTAAHIRAARALLDITQAQLAERVGMSKTGLNNIERGNTDPKASTLNAIERYLVEAGIEFSNGGEPGVRLRRKDPA